MKINDICDYLVDIHQLVDGWHADICWSKWDAEVFEKVKILLQAADDHKEGRAEFVEEKFAPINARAKLCATCQNGDITECDDCIHRDTLINKYRPRTASPEERTMSKNAKRQWEAIVKKHENDIPKRPKKSGLTKPICTMVPLLDLDACLDYAIQEGIITEDDSNAIIEYMKSINEARYWDMHWGDIEQENGIEPEQVKGFRTFYELFKEHEIRVAGLPPETNSFPHLHFDVSVYS